MNVRRAATGVVGLLPVVAVLIVVLSPPSQADPKKLLVSSAASGPFRDNLATPLFKDGAKLVPLDEATQTFYVKNNSHQTARATVAVVNRGATNAFEEALTFDIHIDGASTGGAIPLPGTPGCSLVVTGPSIKAGAVQAVDVSLAVADLQARVGTDRAASLDFVVTLTQTGRNGWVEVCGAQFAAQPEVKGHQGTTGGTDCTRDVVVTASGSPTCVPTAVDAGTTLGGVSRGPALGFVVAGMLILGRVGILLWGGRRRREETT